MSAPVTSEPSLDITPIDLERAVAGRWYLRPHEAARLTGLARSTVFAGLYSGELRGFRRGKSWLIRVEDLRVWIAGAAAGTSKIA